MEEEQHMIWKPSLSSAPEESSSMVSAMMGRVMSTLLSARPRKLQDAISRLDSTPKLGPLGVSLEQSLWVLLKYVRDAAEKEEPEEPVDQILVPMIEHSLKYRQSKHNNQAMVLLNWIFQDDILFQAVVKNLHGIILRRDDHYIALGWCILVRGLVEYEITMNKLLTNGIKGKYHALLKIFSSNVKYLLSIVCRGSTLQGEFELPTRLSVAAADFILALTLALTKKDLISDASENGPKPSVSKAAGLPVTMVPAAASEKKAKQTKKSSELSNSMEMKFLLWDYLDDIIILVQRLIAWSRKSRSLHGKGLAKVLKWLQETKQHYVCFQNEAGSEMLKSGALLLSSCWKHYGKLLLLEDFDFSQHYRELLEQYLSGIQFYSGNFNEERAENKDSGIETIKFFLNCLSLLLGRLDGKQFESAMTEYGQQISQVLMSQLHCADEDVIDGTVCIFKAAIFKRNCSFAGISLSDTGQMDAVLPSLLLLLDERDGAARAVTMLVAEYCSISSDSWCLQEVLKRLASGSLPQRRNAADVISELINISLGSANILSRSMWQEIANHLLQCLGDEELVIQAQASNLISMIDPPLFLPAMVNLIYSPDERIQFCASNTLISVLKYQNQKPDFICMLLDCLSNLCQGSEISVPVGGGIQGQKLDIDRVLKLIPEWSKSVEDWSIIIGPLIDKMFMEPANSTIVKFLSCISEHLAGAADEVFSQVLFHTSRQKEISENFFILETGTSTNVDAIKLQHSLFGRLCPLLIIRLLPLRVFNDLNSSLVYGELLNQYAMDDNGFNNINDIVCIAALLVNRAFNKFEFEDVRKLAAELCGRIDPHVLLPIVSSHLEHAANTRDVLMLKACLFSICTSLVIRGVDSLLHPAMLKIRKTIGSVLLWPSVDGDEVSKAQHGCIDCMALMVCAELQVPGLLKDSSSYATSTFGKNNRSGDATTINSVHSYVIHQLTCNKIDSVSSKLGSENCMPEVTVPLSFRLCMANVLISACQKISDSGKKAFAQKILPSLIHSAGVILESDVKAACVQVLFSSVYHLKSAVLPYTSKILSVSLKSLREGSDKERMAGAKLLASLMASEETVVESISGQLLEARALLLDLSLSDLSSDVRQVCKKLLVCMTS